jgi:hypothetical protein
VVRKTVVPSAGGVEARRRLVEEEHRRLVHEGRAEVEPPPHPAGVGPDAPVSRVGEADTLDQRVAAPDRLGLRNAVQRGLKLHQLAAGHERVERGLLERDADRAADIAGLLHHVEPGHRRAAAGRPEQCGQHPNGRRLAGAVRAKERVDLALGDL